MATGINDRWPLGRNTEALKKPTEPVKTLLDIPPLLCVHEWVVCVKNIPLQPLKAFRLLLFLSVVLKSMSVSHLLGFSV